MRNYENASLDATEEVCLLSASVSGVTFLLGVPFDSPTDLLIISGKTNVTKRALG